MPLDEAVEPRGGFVQTGSPSIRTPSRLLTSSAVVEHREHASSKHESQKLAWFDSSDSSNEYDETLGGRNNSGALRTTTRIDKFQHSLHRVEKREHANHQQNIPSMFEVLNAVEEVLRTCSHLRISIRSVPPAETRSNLVPDTSWFEHIAPK